VFLECKNATYQEWNWIKNGDNHNSKLNTKGQEFIKFTKANVQQENKQNIRTTKNASYSYTNASHMSYHDFDASYVLMRNKFDKSIALHVGPHHKRSKTCVWVHKCFVTNLRESNQTWVPKTKA
jgi:hypothetical protein